MNCKILLTILLGLTVAASCSANELPAKEYIDGTEVNKSWKPYLKIIGELIEKHGAASHEITSQVMREIMWHSAKLSQGLRLADDKYDLVQLKREEIVQFHEISDNIVCLISNMKSCSPIGLEQFLGLIKLFYGDDLDAFANEQLAHERPNLYTFLLHYSKSILLFQIEQDSGEQKYGDYAEKSLESVVAHDLRQDYTQEELISRARNLDLAKGDFNAKSLVQSIERNRGIYLSPRASQQLPPVLSKICDEFSKIFRREIELYTWTRLLMPEKIPETGGPSGDLLKRIELWRVCLPVINSDKYKEVADNIEINMAVSPASSYERSLSGQAFSLSQAAN